MWNLKKPELWKLTTVVVTGGWGMGELEKCEKVQICNFNELVLET